MIRLEDIHKIYRDPRGRTETHALRGVSLEVERGGFLAVTGGSGSGKTTLMNIVGCLDRPTSGRICIDGLEPSRLSDRQRSRIRGEKIGFIFQGFHLLHDRTALENVMLPLSLRGLDRKTQKRQAAEALCRVGLDDRLDHMPGQLSGGQQQRVAIARVIACQTPIILADEPTGNLDPKAAGSIMGILQALCDRGVTLMLITHDPQIAAMAPRRAVMEDGRLRLSSE